MTDGKPEPNGTKILLSFGNAVSIAFRSAEKGKYKWPSNHNQSLLCGVNFGHGNQISKKQCNECRKSDKVDKVWFCKEK
uniref:Uncharacterized protein n=1 Tax=Romanomermis culicivorax TaxID=13658 RepID=A0A915JYY0_ROMCU